MNDPKLQKLLNELYKDLSYVEIERGALKTLMAELSQINSIKELVHYKKRRSRDIKLGQSIRGMDKTHQNAKEEKVVESNEHKLKPSSTKKKQKKITLKIPGTKKPYNIVYESSNDDIQKADLRTFYVIWDDILFDKDKIRFSPNRLDAILPSIGFKGVFEELNNLKQEYFKRLYDKDVYKLTFNRNSLQIDKSPDWKRISDTIEIGKQYFQFKTNVKSSFGPRLSTQSIVKLYKLDFERNQYLKFLASVHDGAFKLIPIIESINAQKEESFIFRVKSNKNNILIVWENINENRATHIFINPPNSHEKDLQKLESFICTPMKTKRIHLHLNSGENQTLKQELKYLKPIKHTTILSYKQEIQNLIKNH